MEFPNTPDRADIEVTFKVNRNELDHIIDDLENVRDPWNEITALLVYLRGL